MTNNLVTSAAALPEDGGVLATLRGLVPHRPLNIDEAKRIAELQANRLRAMFEIDSPTFPHEIIMDMPRIKVVFDVDLPVSGSAHWNGSEWIIVLNALEGSARQRFSMAHEFKHILDHTTKHFLYHDSNGYAASTVTEQVADYFAGCLLMPKSHVKRLYYQGVQRPSELSGHFQVSARAVQFRLQQLGVIGDPARCNRYGEVRPTYYRNKSLAGVAA